MGGFSLNVWMQWMECFSESFSDVWWSHFESVIFPRNCPTSANYSQMIRKFGAFFIILRSIYIRGYVTLMRLVSDYILDSWCRMCRWDHKLSSIFQFPLSPPNPPPISDLESCELHSLALYSMHHSYDHSVFACDISGPYNYFILMAVDCYTFAWHCSCGQ